MNRSTPEVALYLVDAGSCVDTYSIRVGSPFSSFQFDFHLLISFRSISFPFCCKSYQRIQVGLLCNAPCTIRLILLQKGSSLEGQTSMLWTRQVSPLSSFSFTTKESQISLSFLMCDSLDTSQEVGSTLCLVANLSLRNTIPWGDWHGEGCRLFLDLFTMGVDFDKANHVSVILLLCCLSFLHPMY